MTEFFNAMGGFERTLWYIAIPSSLILLITMVLSFLGSGDSTDDVEFEADEMELEGEEGEESGSGFQFFTFRNFVYFFAVFSWTGIVCLGENISKEFTLIISTLTGLAVMTIMASLYYWIHRMSENNAIKLENSIGKTGTVDLLIPSKGLGAGKVNIILGGALRNMNAVSEGPEFQRGAKIKIVKVENNELIVSAE